MIHQSLRHRQKSPLSRSFPRMISSHLSMAVTAVDSIRRGHVIMGHLVLEAVTSQDADGSPIPPLITTRLPFGLYYATLPHSGLSIIIYKSTLKCTRVLVRCRHLFKLEIESLKPRRWSSPKGVVA